MSEIKPQWDCVHLGDGVTASGTVCEIHEREDGLTVFVIRDAKLVEHRPKPRPRITLPKATVAATSIYYWTVQTITSAKA